MWPPMIKHVGNGKFINVRDDPMKLTAGKRKKMPTSSFAGPGKSFPISDPLHARLAIGGATRSMRAGNISPSEAASIKAKARKKLKMNGPLLGGGKTKQKSRSLLG